MRLHLFLILAIPLVLFLNLLTQFYICTTPLETFQNESESIYPDNSQGTDLKFGVSDSVKVEVTKHRWYGTIYEADNQKTLNTLGIGILLGCNGKSLELLHLSTSALVLLLLILAIVRYRKERIVVLR